MAAGNSLGHPANRNFPAGQFVHVELDRGRAAADSDPAGTPCPDSATARSEEVPAGKLSAGISPGLRPWNPLVLRKLLLGVQHHEAVQRPQRVRSRRFAVSILSLSWPISRPVRAD